MRIQADEKKKLAVVWLTNADQADQEQQEELQSLYREYRAKKYTVAVFRSGREDLAPLTSHLLCHNRVCAAREELRLEEQERAEQETDMEQVRGEGAWQIRGQREAYQGPTMTFG